MKLNWKKWLKRLHSWTVVDTETNSWVEVKRTSKACSHDICLTESDPLAQVYYNLEFDDFKIARALTKTANYIGNNSRYLIMWTDIKR